MNKLLLPTVWLIIAVCVYSKPAHAAECWKRGADDHITVPAGKALVPGGYVCVDHLGTYAEVIGGNGPHELVLPHRGLPRSEPRARITPRPAWRNRELVAAGL